VPYAALGQPVRRITSAVPQPSAVAGMIQQPKAPTEVITLMRHTRHIRQPSRDSWEIRYRLGTDPANEGVALPPRPSPGSHKDAEKKLRRLLRALDTAEHVDLRRITVREWLATTRKSRPRRINDMVRSLITFSSR
jgi:hypothetical protein